MQHLIEPKHQLKPLYSVQLTNRFIRGLEPACYGGSLGKSGGSDLCICMPCQARKKDHKLVPQGENVKEISGEESSVLKVW